MMMERIEENRRATARNATGVIIPGLVLALAAAVQGDGALITAVFRSQSRVSDDLFSFPWTGSTAIATSLIWGTMQVLITFGLVAFSRSQPDVPRSGAVGARMAVAGSILYVAGHALSIVVHDAELDDAGAVVAMSLFGIGTILTAVGLLLAGVAMRRSGSWTGWRRSTPLALGIWMVVMVPLQFTAALPLAVAVYSAATVALGVALAQESMIADFDVAP